MNKKDKILQCALELFANDGYNAVSTQRIAAKAGVSEGLIFKHFKNKKGLLSEIMEEAERKIAEIFANILLGKDPKSAIRDTINLVFEVDESEHDFWRLQYKLKWEQEFFNPAKMQPVLNKLSWAFAQLDYPFPELEADLLVKIIDAVAIAILQDSPQSQELIKSFLIKKYNIEEE